MKRDDDRCLNFSPQERLEAERSHAADQRVKVIGIACQSRRLPALFDKLRQCFRQCRDHMGGRCEAPLRGFFHIRILVKKVHGERMRIADTTVKHGLADKNEAHSGYTLDAFAACCDQRIEMHGPCVDVDGGKGAHRIDDQSFAMTLAYIAHRLQGIEYAGAGLAVDQTNVRDGWIGFKMCLKLIGRNRFVLGALKDAGTTAHQCCELAHAFTVGTVVQYQHVTIAWHQCGDCGFDRKRAAALQGNHHMRTAAVNDIK